MIKSRSVSVTEEKRIVTGLITSTKFTKIILPVLDLAYFTNSYLRILAEWCIAFFEEHEKAPFKHIQDIYESESHNLKESEAELIGDLLNMLSEQYDEDSINVDYLKDCALDYFRKRELEIVVNNVSVLKEKGEYDAAESEIDRFTRVTLEIDSDAIINLGDINQIAEIYRQRDEEDKNFFQLPGDLGRYLGNHKRGDVVGYYAPAKRGKSWTLVDNFKHGILSKKRTMFWSIEMTKTEIIPRIMKTFEPMVGEGGEHTFPVFDCKRNQTGECKDRESEVIIYDGIELIEDPAHKPCTKCMKRFGQKSTHKYNFEMTVYQDTIFRKPDDIFTVQDKMKSMKRLFNKYGRVSVHPKYTLTYDKMMRDIDVVYKMDGYIPDILIIDYIDIMDINSNFDDYREIDEKWKLMAKIAGELNVLVITATQANKEGHKATVLDSTHQSGFYGKNQHVNLMIGINQTPEEKDQGIIKYGITEARSQYYVPGKTCVVLQDVKAGQAYLDSYYDEHQKIVIPKKIDYKQ